jgi:hypothetical protein
MQDGFMFIMNVRQTGFAPGNSTTILDPTNPRTRVRAFFADTNVPLVTVPSSSPPGGCPYRTAYKDIGGGQYELVQMVAIMFDTCWRSGNLIGKQFRIEGEMLDWNGTTYAKQTLLVTAAAPTEPPEYWPNEPDAPGCPQ